MRKIAVVMLATGFAVATVGLNAQDTTVKTKTKSSGGDVKPTMFTGCVADGTETRTYMLNKVVPVTKTTETVGPEGSVSTTETTYMLVPGERVQIEQHVGHKVEVSGMMIPAGDVKTETKTKIDRKDAKDTTIREKTKVNNAAAQFRVTSIKDLADRCE